MSMAIIKNFSKSYDKLKAVENFNLSAEKGKILALVGPDGAGKTTMFRSACGLLDFDSGSITIAGYNVVNQFDNIKPLLGYMPQNFSLYPDLSVEENLKFYAGLFGLSGHEFDQKKKRLYEFSNLGPFAKRRAEALSGGMKQKLALSCNLIHDPEVLILDEPTTGVDPLSRRQFWDILKTLRDDGSTIIVSTPYMDEVALADKSIFIFNGKNMAEGTPDELTGLFRGDVFLFDGVFSIEQMDTLNNLDGLSIRRFGSAVHIYVDEGNRPESYNSELDRFGINAQNLDRINPGLEDIFIQLMDKT